MKFCVIMTNIYHGSIITTHSDQYQHYFAPSFEPFITQHKGACISRVYATCTTHTKWDSFPPPSYYPLP